MTKKQLEEYRAVIAIRKSLVVVRNGIHSGDFTPEEIKKHLTEVKVAIDNLIHLCEKQ